MEVQDIPNLQPILKKSIPVLKEYKNIGLSYSIQHRHDIENDKKFYESHGKRSLFRTRQEQMPTKDTLPVVNTLVLREIQDEVECFVIIGKPIPLDGCGT